MGRRVRVFAVGFAHHISLKAIKDLVVFKDEEDYKVFLSFLKELYKTFDVQIHSYLLKEDGFNFLLTPLKKDSISKFMQSLGRRYVRYYNQKYHRNGTLWEGRYKSSIVQDRFVFNVMLFLESQDGVSSKEVNLKANSDGIVTFHKVYKELGYTPLIRSQKYQEVFKKGLNDSEKRFIEESLQKQQVTGSKEFVKNLEKQLGVILLKNNRGRPQKNKNQNKGKKMYKNLVVLDKEKHKNLKVKPMKDLKYAKGLAFVPIVASEVELVSKSFPVVFTAEEIPSLVALVSLGGDSLAINEEGKWISDYVPLFLRRYPFSLASTKENPNQKIVLIDEDSELVSEEEGTNLFDEDQNPTQALDHAIKFLNEYDKQIQITKKINEEIAKSGILEDREITVGEGEEKKVLVDGFKVVNKEKLNELSDDVLADWARRGIFCMIEDHIKSLNNIQKLFNLAMQKQNLK